MYSTDNALRNIKTHDFEEAKNSLKKYSAQVPGRVRVPSVPEKCGPFHVFNHKVTGEELNEVTSAIQSYLIKLNELSQGFVDEFGQVYKAFDSLDKDYISGILTSLKATQEVSDQERETRDTIKKTVKVLSQFQQELEQLRHLRDIDKVWDLIDEQESWILSLCEYRDKLTVLRHLKDVDKLWEDQQTQEMAIERVEKRFLELYQGVKEQNEAISRFHEMFQSVEDQLRQLTEATASLEEEKCTLTAKVSDLTQKVKISYAIAGSAAVITIIHVVLSVFGVL